MLLLLMVVACILVYVWLLRCGVWMRSTHVYMMRMRGIGCVWCCEVAEERMRLVVGVDVMCWDDDVLGYVGVRAVGWGLCVFVGGEEGFRGGMRAEGVVDDEDGCGLWW